MTKLSTVHHPSHHHPSQHHPSQHHPSQYHPSHHPSHHHPSSITSSITTSSKNNHLSLQRRRIYRVSYPSLFALSSSLTMGPPKRPTPQEAPSKPSTTQTERTRRKAAKKANEGIQKV